MNHNFRLWLELWFKLWFGVWLKLWPKIEESSMISLQGGGLVAAFFWCARGDPGSRARPGPRDPGPGPGRGPRAHQKMQPPTPQLGVIFLNIEKYFSTLRKITPIMH